MNRVREKSDIWDKISKMKKLTRLEGIIIGGLILSAGIIVGDKIGREILEKRNNEMSIEVGSIVNRNQPVSFLGHYKESSRDAEIGVYLNSRLIKKGLLEGQEGAPHEIKLRLDPINYPFNSGTNIISMIKKDKYGREINSISTEIVVRDR